MKVFQISLVSLTMSSSSAATLRGDSERDLAVLYYPRYTNDFATGWCSTTNQYSNGSPGYSTELECCNHAFLGQTSGKCYSMLPSPPTASPTATGGPDVWYANYDLDFSKGECTNKMPVPNGRVTYDSELDCCKGQYPGVQSCLKSLPNPPTISPTATGGPDVWYANFNLDWSKGECINKMPVPIGRQTYDSELECCKGQYPGVQSCLKSLPNPPTVSPTATGGPDVWYPNFDLDWAKGECTNKIPVPIGRQTFDSELECCKGAYSGQASGACLKALPNPPTVSPTATGGPDVWYANYDLDWSKGECTNKIPVPNGRQTFDSELECCKGQYPGVESCLKALPNPPTVSPTATGGPDVWYPNFDLDWAKGECTNKIPVPIGRQTFDSELECCKGAYSGQASGACLKALPNPPTVSPTATGGPDVWYANIDLDWAKGECTNKMPVPNGRQTFDSELECCKGAYSGQASGACLKALPNPPTASPIGSDAPFFPIWSGGFDNGHCDNDPTKNKSGYTYKYDTQEECCNAWFLNQKTRACMKFDPTYGSRSPTQAPIQ